MNPYELLNVEKTATADEVRRAYRREALKVHPDQSGEGDKFLALVKARDVLLDPVARDRFDHFGLMPDEAKIVPAIAMIRELAPQCAAKFANQNLLFSIKSALKIKRKEFEQAANELQKQIDRVEMSWEPGELKTHIVQEFFGRKSMFLAHVATVDVALGICDGAKCNEISQPSIGGSWVVGSSW